MFFFFNQKTAYEMRISDWSSDVCSSDLLDAFAPHSKKIHVDIDRSSVNKNVRVDLPVIADVGHALADMIRVWKERRHPRPDLGEWWRRIDGWRATRSLDFPETDPARSEEHTSELQSLMRSSYAVFCLKKKHLNTR